MSVKAGLVAPAVVVRIASFLADRYTSRTAPRARRIRARSPRQAQRCIHVTIEYRSRPGPDAHIVKSLALLHCEPVHPWLLTSVVLLTACGRIGYDPVDKDKTDANTSIDSGLDAGEPFDSGVALPDAGPTECSLEPCEVVSGLLPTFALSTTNELLAFAESSGSGGGIWVAQLDGTAPRRLADSGRFVYGLGVDATRIFWTYDRGVRSVELTGGATSEMAGTTGRGNGLTLDQGWVYWTEDKDVYPSGGGIYRMPVTGGIAQELFDPNTSFANIVVQGDRVYATHYGRTGPAAGYVGWIPKSGGAFTRIADNQEGPWGIAADSNAVYWVNHSGGQVMRWPIDGGPPQILASSDAGVHGIAVFDGIAYVANDRTGAVFKILGDGTVQLLASNVGKAKYLSVQGPFVYVTDYAGARIIRLAR
jgi:hypothetical protein